MESLINQTAQILSSGSLLCTHRCLLPLILIQSGRIVVLCCCHSPSSMSQ